MAVEVSARQRQALELGLLRDKLGFLGAGLAHDIYGEYWGLLARVDLAVHRPDDTARENQA